MWLRVAAFDYDGTLATDGRLDEPTAAALRRVRATGRRTLLVTGRGLDDLLAVCPAIDLFDLVVAENGAVLFDPAARRTTDLAPAPPPEFLDALRARGVPFGTGRRIVATVVPWETVVIEVIRTLGLELQIVFNREAVMILPAGVSKESGLAAALDRLGVSRHDVLAVGDGENDHAFVERAGLGVAVANAVPSLLAVADRVTRGAAGAGVRELVDDLVEGRLDRLRTELPGRAVTVGRTADDRPVDVAVYGPNLLVTGPSGTGKSTLAGVFVEGLVREDYVVCIVDPEGDFRSLASHERIVVLAAEAGAPTARVDDVPELIRHRSTSVVVDLVGLDRDERVVATGALLGALHRVRAETGAPHWIVLDEAHHLFPPGGSTAQQALGEEPEGVCLVSNEPAAVDPAVRALGRRVLSTSLLALADPLGVVPADRLEGVELAPGEAVSAEPGDGGRVRLERFRVVERETAHRRHVRKYATGRLPDDRHFHFRGPAGAMDLVAHNLESFSMLARGVDAATWAYHLRSGDVARWLRAEIKDEELAREVEAIGARPDAEAGRDAVLAAIARRYTPTAGPRT